ncbi:MAG: hypothetical protein AAFP03_04040 [Cyanobacteria bacterium J06598_3]
MYYPDLSYYRVGNLSSESVAVFPEYRNIGWLWKNEPFREGKVSNSLICKLKEMLFLDIKNIEDKRNGMFEESRAIWIHQEYLRGTPHKCQFCGKEEIRLSPDGLSCYTGKSTKLLGGNQISIPSVEKGEFYVFPTLLYHYIVEHNYQPPQESLEAVEAFDLGKSYDSNKEQADEICIKVPGNLVNTLHLQPIPKGLYPSCEDD